MGDELMHQIANAFSTLTIMSSLFLKVPQILHMKAKKSADGIFVQTMLMEVVGFTIMTLYNYTNKYSIMTYMEYPIILLQVYVMFYYVLKFKGLLKRPIVPVATVAYTCLVVGYVIEALPTTALTFLVPFCTPLSGFAKVTYIYGIIHAGNADGVSLTTWIISVGTNLARIFTVYVDSADRNLIFNFSVSTALSSGVLLTALYYKRNGARTSSSDSNYESCHCHED